MSSKRSSRTTASDVGQHAKYEELNERYLYSTPHQEHEPAHPGVDGRPGAPAGRATDADGQELRPSRRREYDARTDATYTVGDAGVETVEDGQALGDRLDTGEAGRLVGATADGAYWQEALVAGRDETLDGLGDPFEGTAGREAFTLATEERIEGEHRQRERQREKAHAAVATGVDRAAACREEVSAMVTTTVAPSEQRRPQEMLSREELGAVNRHATRLADRLNGGPSRAALSRRLAERVTDGQDVTDAALTLLEELYGNAEAVAPIGQIDPRQYEADIQGTVTKLFAPLSPSQQQVGYVTDESGASVKVTIWEKSRQDTVLREGDEVRIRGGKPSSYNGQLTLAVTHDTVVTVVERGDGPAPVHHTARKAVWAGASDLRGEQRLNPCTVPDGIEGRILRPEAARFEGSESWTFPIEACPDWWLAREAVEAVEPETAVETQSGAVADD